MVSVCLKACFSLDVDSYTAKVLKSKSVVQVGFEPTPPKRLVPKTSALGPLGHATLEFVFIYLV